MTAQICNFPAAARSVATIEDALGGCPRCGEIHQYLNLGRDHWGICHTHKTKWCLGRHLFSSWRNETEEDWARNRARLASYTTIE